MRAIQFLPPVAIGVLTAVGSAAASWFLEGRADGISETITTGVLCAGTLLWINFKLENRENSRTERDADITTRLATIERSLRIPGVGVQLKYGT